MAGNRLPPPSAASGHSVNSEGVKKKCVTSLSSVNPHRRPSPSHPQKPPGRQAPGDSAGDAARTATATGTEEAERSECGEEPGAPRSPGNASSGRSARPSKTALRLQEAGLGGGDLPESYARGRHRTTASSCAIASRPPAAEKLRPRISEQGPAETPSPGHKAPCFLRGLTGARALCWRSEAV